MEIEERPTDLPSLKPIRERMGVHIDGVSRNIPHRNGFVYFLCGSGGSGKSSLLMSMFKSKAYYRCKFDNIYYFCPEESMLSVECHPFTHHSHVYHELSVSILEGIAQQLAELKAQAVEDKRPIENSCIIIDDFASVLKDNELVRSLNRIITKTRHLGCSWIFTLQAYYLCPKILRKQCTNCTIFRPRNAQEWSAINSEMLMMTREQLTQLHDYIFDEPYNHLDVDTFENKLYKNFNELIIRKKDH